jgi:hypothetical protein
MDSTQIETVLQNMGNLLIHVSNATADVLDINVSNLTSEAVVRQRTTASKIRQNVSSLQAELRSVEKGQ